MNYGTVQEVIENLNENRYRIQRNVSKNFGVHNHENFLAELRDFIPMMVAYDHRLNVFTVTCSDDPSVLRASEILLVSAGDVRSAFALAEYNLDAQALEVFRISIQSGLRRALARLGESYDKTINRSTYELVEILTERLSND